MKTLKAFAVDQNHRSHRSVHSKHWLADAKDCSPPSTLVMKRSKLHFSACWSINASRLSFDGHLSIPCSPSHHRHPWSIVLLVTCECCRVRISCDREWSPLSGQRQRQRQGRLDVTASSPSSAKFNWFEAIDVDDETRDSPRKKNRRKTAPRRGIQTVEHRRYCCNAKVRPFIRWKNTVYYRGLWSCGFKRFPHT